MLDEIVNLKLADFWRPLTDAEIHMSNHGDQIRTAHNAPERFGDVRRLLTEGWADGANMMRGAAATLREGTIERVRPRIERGQLFGFDPNIGILLDGRPDAFSLWEGRKPRKLIKFVVEVGNAGVNYPVEAIASLGYNQGWGWQGAVALALAEDYDARGYQVEIDAVEMTAAYPVGRHGTIRAITKMNVKSAEETLAPDFLAAILSNSQVYTYGWLQQCERIRCVAEGHGAIFTLTPEDLTQIGYDTAGVVHVPLTIRSRSDAQGWLAAHEAGRDFMPTDGSTLAQWQALRP